jgi:DUF4097 and DUF4098 domain-containing protein YvlB
MSTTKSTNIKQTKRTVVLLTICFVFFGGFMKNIDQTNASPQKNRINCLSNPDEWNAMSYSCSEKESVIPVTDSGLAVIAGGQGAIAINVWQRNEIKIRVVSEVWGESETTAKKVLSEANYKIENNRLTATFPKKESYAEPWGVSFELTVPETYNLALSTVNGAIYVDDLSGNIAAQAVNGAVYLNGVSGKVSGKSTNGRVQANLKNLQWEGDSLELFAQNGDVAVFLSKDFSADFSAETERGKLFIQDKTYFLTALEKKLNSGGKPINARSENGNILVYLQK